MSYRVACIYMEENSRLKEVRLEVCNDTTSSQISPFMRKVSVSNLASDENLLTRDFAAVLNNLGYEYQPFILGRQELNHREVIKLLNMNAYNFIQNGNSRSLKKGKCPLIEERCTLQSGDLLGGSLYVSNLSDWGNGISVRLRYRNAIAEVLPSYNDYPLKTINGGYVNRDRFAEEQFLSTLHPCILTEHGTISLPKDSVGFLESLESRGWDIFYAKGKAKVSKVHFHRTSSGINWFSTSEEPEDDITSKLLEAYLQGRNFQQGRTATVFFSENSIEKLSGENFARDYIRDKGLIDKYQDVWVSSNEKDDIRKKIEREFNAILRDYQWDGVFWLASMSKKSCGCILADEMGLGKTVQVLAHLLVEEGPRHLIVVPTSLVSNWSAEIERFVPSWNCDVCINSRIPDISKRIHIITYELLRRNISHYASLNFDTLVLDEAQVLKNDNTQRHKVISQLNFRQGIVMTGTPVENAVDDVWSYFYIMMPGMRVVHDRLKKLSDGQTNTDSFLKLSSKLLNPFILRRTKKEYLKSLPPCTERNIYVDFDKEEKETYKKIHKVFVKAMKDGTSGRVTSIALEALLRLRQTCVSVSLLPPSLYKGGNRVSTKMILALEQIGKLGIEDKIIVFSQFVQALEELEKYMTKMNIPYVNLYGTTTDRDAPVKTFQNDKNVKVFLSSIKAGGVGLNLTAADYVLLLDDWWNPAVEAQAFSRAHRIGQQRPVEVIRLICKDTVEEKILELQKQKQQTADVFNLSGGKLTIDELKNLLS